MPGAAPARWPLAFLLQAVTAAAALSGGGRGEAGGVTTALSSPSSRALPGNVKWLSFYDFNASEQHGWSTIGQGTHAGQLAVAWEQYRMPGMLDVEDLHGAGHSCGARGCYKDGLYHREWANTSRLNPYWQEMLTATLNESRAAIDSGALQGFFLGDGATVCAHRVLLHVLRAPLIPCRAPSDLRAAAATAEVCCSGITVAEIGQVASFIKARVPAHVFTYLNGETQYTLNYFSYEGLPRADFPPLLPLLSGLIHRRGVAHQSAGTPSTTPR
eukprot:SAG22_NODE_1722_length_3723_cov_4.966060_1_plen_272_part_00